MRNKIFATLDKINPNTENIKALSLEAVRTATVQATKLPF
jgi:pyrrolidone-carboxylate peptidase